MNFGAFIFKADAEPSVEEVQQVFVAVLRENQEAGWAAALWGYILQTRKIPELNGIPYLSDIPEQMKKSAFIQHAKSARQHPSPDDVWEYFEMSDGAGQEYSCCIAFSAADIDQEIKASLAEMKRIVKPLIDKGHIAHVNDLALLGALFPGRVVANDVWVAFSTKVGQVELTGPCVIAKQSEIGDSCKIGPFVWVQSSTIADHCQVQDARISTSKLGNRVVVQDSSINNSYVGGPNRIIRSRLTDTVVPEGRFL